MFAVCLMLSNILNDFGDPEGWRRQGKQNWQSDTICYNRAQIMLRGGYKQGVMVAHRRALSLVFVKVASQRR